MKTREGGRLCAVAWLRHQKTGVGTPYHEADPVVAPEGLHVRTLGGFQVPAQVCKHCGCLYVERMPDHARRDPGVQPS